MAIRDRLPGRRRRSAGRLSLQELREQLGVRRVDVARRLGRTPQAVLQFEQGLDPKVSTLCDYVRALADELDSITGDVMVTAKFDDATYELDLGTEPEPGPLPGADRGSRRAAPTRPPVTSNSDAWKVGSATWFTPSQVEEMLAGGYIAMSEDEIDVSDSPDDRTLAKRLRDAPREAERQSTERAIQTFVRYWRTFLTAIRPGDVVVLPRHDRNAAIGVVLDEAFYDAEEPDPKLRHRRRVDWFCPDVAKADLPDDLARSAGARGTIGMIRAPNAVERLLDVRN